MGYCFIHAKAMRRPENRVRQYVPAPYFYFKVRTWVRGGKENVIMDEKLERLVKSFCTGITQPDSKIINIFDLRRAVCTAHYIYTNGVSLRNEDFVDALKQNEHFRLNDEKYSELAKCLIDEINEIKEIYRVTAELEGLHI